jgi:hypothetical protein
MNYTNAEGMTTWGISEAQVKAIKAAEIEKENNAKRIEEWHRQVAIETIEREIRDAKVNAERKARAIEFALAHPLIKAGKFRSAIATSAPCHADCWFAVGDTCQCSCAGRNHGIGRNPRTEELTGIEKSTK